MRGLENPQMAATRPMCRPKAMLRKEKKASYPPQSTICIRSGIIQSIQDIGTVKGYFFFRQTDPKKQKFYFGKEAYFVKDTRYSNADAGFVVVLPEQMKATNEMQALINRYKLVSVEYWIVNSTNKV